jgi:hypothetical protein
MPNRADIPTAATNPTNDEEDGMPTIIRLGHRNYVGGLWDEIGKLQFDFLVRHGLKPDHCLLDIGCGCLRAGIHLIKYLAPANYLGLDKEQVLIDLGIEKELGRDTYETKRPEFVVSSSFEFDRFSKKPDYSIAQSLFTHLVSEHIELCLAKLRSVVRSGHVFFATFFLGNDDKNPQESHSRLCFWYSVEQMQQMGRNHGWEPTYMGDWNHPRNQMMMKYLAV